MSLVVFCVSYLLLRIRFDRLLCICPVWAGSMFLFSSCVVLVLYSSRIIHVRRSCVLILLSLMGIVLQFLFVLRTFCCMSLCVLCRFHMPMGSDLLVWWFVCCIFLLLPLRLFLFGSLPFYWVLVSIVCIPCRWLVSVPLLPNILLFCF